MRLDVQTDESMTEVEYQPHIASKCHSVSQKTRNKFPRCLLIVSEDLLRVEQCITYLHRIGFRSCYAVTFAHTNFGGEERPASESSMIPGIVAFWVVKSEI